MTTTPTAAGASRRDSRTSWPDGMLIRPCADGQVEVADVITGRLAQWDPDTLATHVTGNAVIGVGAAVEGYGDDAATPDQRIVAGIRRWWRHGWHPSDQFYLASRRDHLAGGCGATEAAGRSPDAGLPARGSPPARNMPLGTLTALGVPREPTAVSVSQLLVTRRSGRTYDNVPVPTEDLSGLLWHGLAEVRQQRRASIGSAPHSQAGHTYGLAWDFYLCVYNVAGLEPGVYCYDVLEHEVILIRPGDYRVEMAGILQGMRSSRTAAWTLGLVADFPVYQWWCRHEHALSALYLESGVLAQGLTILAMAYGLTTLVTPAQQDSPYLALHGLSADRHAPIYTLTMGRRSRNGGGLHEGQGILGTEGGR